MQNKKLNITGAALSALIFLNLKIGIEGEN